MAARSTDCSATSSTACERDPVQTRRRPDEGVARVGDAVDRIDFVTLAGEDFVMGLEPLRGDAHKSPGKAAERADDGARTHDLRHGKATL